MNYFKASALRLLEDICAYLANQGGIIKAAQLSKMSGEKSQTSVGPLKRNSQKLIKARNRWRERRLPEFSLTVKHTKAARHTFVQQWFSTSTLDTQDKSEGSGNNPNK